MHSSGASARGSFAQLCSKRVTNEYSPKTETPAYPVTQKYRPTSNHAALLRALTHGWAETIVSREAPASLQRARRLPFPYEPSELAHAVANLLRALADCGSADAQPECRAVGRYRAIRVLGGANPVNCRGDGLGGWLSSATEFPDHDPGDFARSDCGQTLDNGGVYCARGYAPGSRVDGRDHHRKRVHDIGFAEHCFCGRIYDCCIDAGQDENGAAGVCVGGVDLRGSPSLFSTARTRIVVARGHQRAGFRRTVFLSVLESPGRPHQTTP